MISTDKLLANSATRKIVFTFVDNLPKRVEKIKQDIKCGSRADLKHDAHELKGTAANFGFVDIANAAAALEEYADYSSLNNLKDYVTEVEYFSLQASNNLRSIH